MRALGAVGLADQVLEAVGIAQLSVGDEVQLSLEVILGVDLAGAAEVIDPEQGRGAESANLGVVRAA